MNDIEDIREEKGKVFKEMVQYSPDTEEYKDRLKAFEKLNDIESKITYEYFESINKEKALEIQEKEQAAKAANDCEITKVKDKDSRRNFIKGMFTVVLSALCAVATLFADSFVPGITQKMREYTHFPK